MRRNLSGSSKVTLWLVLSAIAFPVYEQEVAKVIHLTDDDTLKVVYRGTEERLDSLISVLLRTRLTLRQKGMPSERGGS